MSYRILVGDVLEQLRTLPDESVHCVVTSPPYWGLRDYDFADQIGLEPTLPQYIKRLVGVFAEAKRVLADDGVFWLNIGDGYTSGNRGWRAPDKKNGARAMKVRPDTPEGLKPKDLHGIPWRLAFALQEDGWYLRADVIWHKPNAMPESVKDRPTRAHEYLFMFTKSERYFWDAEAVREAKSGLINVEPTSARNLRTVWTLATEPYGEAHFATFPTALARRCILAGTSARGVCAGCGAPYVRVVKWEASVSERHADGHGSHCPPSHHAGQTPHRKGNFHPTVAELGWRPSCSCDAGDPPVPATVLDPFAGSGTVALTAEKLGRDSINIDLSPPYADMMRRRIENGKITKSFREFLEERPDLVTRRPVRVRTRTRIRS